MVAVITHEMYTREVKLPTASSTLSIVEDDRVVGVLQTFHCVQFRSGLGTIGVDELLVLYLSSS